MALCKLCILGILLQVLYRTNCSMVKINNNGYEDIVIAINPNSTEDAKLITSIQDMITEASTYLYQATKNRLFIRSAKILIPMNWSPNSKYLKPKTETYDKADVIIANPFWKFPSQQPYTLQYGGCGEQGRYIHFTPDYLTNDELNKAFGPQGKVFVHEWAHYRWGVFDESNKEVPYYISNNGDKEATREATRCSLSIEGKNQQRYQGNLIDCEIDTSTGLYKEGCEFYPKKDQLIKESIMFSQDMTHVTDFCDKNTHNDEAPNLQNKVCNLRSTWDVIMSSDDMKSTTPITSPSIPVPSFSLLQHKNRVVTLVLDVSGSMNDNDRIGRLYQAAEVFLIQIIEINSYIGIVKFSSSASIISNLRQITDDTQRVNLKNLLPKTAVGGTHICSGIRSGLQVNRQRDGSSFGTEIVLLTDGEDNYDTSLCFPDIKASGAIIHVIALGPNAAKELEQIADMTEGLRFSATDNLDANGLIDAFNGISAGNGNLSQQSIQLESNGNNIKPTNCLTGEVHVDQTVGIKTYFLVTWQSSMPRITLTDPKGTIYANNQFKSDPYSKSARLEIPGKAERGSWSYSICNTFQYNQVLGITVNSQASDSNVPPIIVDAHMSADVSDRNQPLVIYAMVSQGMIPIKGANVTAIIEPQIGNSVTQQLLDNGAGADIVKNDGIYSAYFFMFSNNGRYNLKVRVEGKEGKINLVPPKSPAFYAPGYVENGEIVLNPPQPAVNVDDLILNTGSFSRTATGGSFMVSNVGSGSLSDIYKPERITDLDAEVKDTSIVLSWTATGDDLDQGEATRYDLRMSTNFKELKDNFESCISVNISSLTPQPAGSTETFTFLPEHISIANITVIYLGLIAFDDVSQKSKLSNIARAAIIIPPPPPPKPTEHHKCNG
ncbi:calcium-activated chloride channel regulator 1-like [Bombina bombina]|uniref:calcium-activated chloride channel regulator 1-like n=1 Tax=Bombina bombina TaxID=8345 RepID=UPI00235A799C|nr:calcium-activated chloride channel regulator 1-like [Bombina bombina]